MLEWFVSPFLIMDPIDGVGDHDLTEIDIIEKISSAYLTQEEEFARRPYLLDPDDTRQSYREDLKITDSNIRRRAIIPYIKRKFPKLKRIDAYDIKNETIVSLANNLPKGLPK